MEELKQRLSRTSISSDMDIDRIVKESKTTTITEARETVFFRPRDGSKKRESPSTVEAPGMKRLSIMDSETEERRPRKRSTSRSSIAQPSDASSMPPQNLLAIPVTSGDSAPESANDVDVDDLLAGYQNLEKELEEIHEQKKELRKKFFEGKKETPFLSSTSSAAPLSSTRIQEWKTSTTKQPEPATREKKKCSFIVESPSDPKPGTSTALAAMPTEASKSSTCPYNFIK